MVFRIGTILGPTVQNQITALWDGRRILAIRGSDSPFVFIWVDDVAGAMARAATDGPPGIYNVAGDGRLTVREIAARLGKPLLTVPPGVLAFALRVGRMLRLTVHGPEQVGFLRYRPVLANDALKHDFGFTPAKTSAEAFEAYLDDAPRRRAALTEPAAIRWRRPARRRSARPRQSARHRTSSPSSPVAAAHVRPKSDVVQRRISAAHDRRSSTPDVPSTAGSRRTSGSSGTSTPSSRQRALARHGLERSACRIAANRSGSRLVARCVVTPRATADVAVRRATPLTARRALGARLDCVIAADALGVCVPSTRASQLATVGARPPSA